jgi:rubrerythrin
MIKLPESIGESVALATRMETDGASFYAQAAHKVKSPMGKMMFQSLVKDEQNHLRVLREIVGSMFHQTLEEAFAGTPVSRVRSVYAEQRQGLDQRVAADPGDLEVLQIAMGMEERSVKLYQEAAAASADPSARALFQRLVEEERQHFQMLQSTHTFLSDTGNWYIYQEHATMDGG